jgi:hypothetical protein
MRRSRIAQILNGDPAASPLGGAHRHGAPYASHRAPQRVRFWSSLAAALLNGHFEQPANQVRTFLPCFHSNTPTQSVSSPSVKTLASTIHLSSTNLYLF